MAEKPAVTASLPQFKNWSSIFYNEAPMPFTVLGQWNESKQAVSAITDIDTKYLRLSQGQSGDHFTLQILTTD